MNRILINGYLGKDAELKYLQSGMAVANFSVGSTHKTKGKEDRTTWFNCVVWDKAAEACGKLAKGSHVMVDGRIESEEYEKDGQKKTAWKVTANNVAVVCFPKKGTLTKDDIKTVGPNEPDDFQVPF